MSVDLVQSLLPMNPGPGGPGVDALAPIPGEAGDFAGLLSAMAASPGETGPAPAGLGRALPAAESTTTAAVVANLAGAGVGEIALLAPGKPVIGTEAVAGALSTDLIRSPQAGLPEARPAQAQEDGEDAALQGPSLGRDIFPAAATDVSGEALVLALAGLAGVVPAAAPPAPNTPALQDLPIPEAPGRPARTASPAPATGPRQLQAAPSGEAGMIPAATAPASDPGPAPELRLAQGASDPSLPPRTDAVATGPVPTTSPASSPLSPPPPAAPATLAATPEVTRITGQRAAATPVEVPAGAVEAPPTAPISEPVAEAISTRPGAAEASAPGPGSGPATETQAETAGLLAAAAAPATPRRSEAPPARVSGARSAVPAREAPAVTADAGASLTPNPAASAPVRLASDAMAPQADRPETAGDPAETPVAGRAAERAAPDAPSASPPPPAAVELRATPPAVAPPAPRATSETVAALAVQAARKLDDGITRFDLELNPADLGRVDVRLEIDSAGRVRAAFSFETPHSARELSRRADDLQRSLETAGFDLSGGLSFDVAGDRSQGRAQGWGGDPDSRPQPLARLEPEGGAEPAAETSLPLPRRGLSVRAGVDIRI